MLNLHSRLNAGRQTPRHAAPLPSRLVLLQHQQPSKPKNCTITQATRDVNFAFQQDIQTKLKPGDFADRMDNKSSKVAETADWLTVVRLFGELGENTDRNIGLVGDMLVQLQRLVPAGTAARLSPQEARMLGNGINAMCMVLLDNVTRVNNKLLINVVWALALLPDPVKLVKSPATAAARTRAVAGFGAAVITRLPKLTAEDLFHVAAALALLGFKPPRMLTRERQPRPNEQGGQDLNLEPQEPMKFGTLLEKRSIKVMHYLSPKTVADAAFVMARLVPPGDVSAEWLGLYCQVSKQQLPTMQPEAVVYAGYALARHGFKPSNSWQKAYIAAMHGLAKTLNGEEFPMVLFTLARWQQQRQQQEGQQQQQVVEDYDDLEDDIGQITSSGYVQGTGVVVTQALVDDLLFASHTNRALRELPLGQLVVMVKAVTELPVTVHPMWLQRVWPMVNSKIDAAVAAAAASSTNTAAAVAGMASDLAALLSVIPRINPAPTLPANFVEGLVGNLGLGLQQLNPNELAGVWSALQQLQPTPDVIFQRQLQAAVLQAVQKAAPRDLAVLLQVGLAVGLNLSSSSDSTGVQGLMTADAFCQQFLDGFVQEVQQRVNLAAGGSTSAQQRQQQRLQLLQNAAVQGLWQLPQTLQTCVQHVNTALKQNGSSTDAAAVAVVRNAVPQLQKLWQDSTVALAAVLPTEPLLVLLGFVLDLSGSDAAVLGLSGSSSKRDTVAAILQSGVYQYLDSTAAARSDRTRSASPRLPNDRSDLLINFSLEDLTELLVITGDADLAGAAENAALLDTAAEALHGALAPKGPAFGFNATPETAEDLVREMVSGFNYSLPSKVKTRYKKWLEGLGLQMPAELTARKKSSKPAKKAATKAIKAVEAAAVETQDVGSARAASLPAAVVIEAQPSKKAAAAVMEEVAPAALTPPPPAAAPVVDDGIVRSSRNRSRQ